MGIALTKANLNFEIRQEIGLEGKNSNVYLCHDKQLDAEIVIKKVLKSKLDKPDEFYSESKRLYLSEHQHVVQIKYACEDDEHIYLAMPYYKNGSLKKLIDKRFLTVREIVRYSTQFLSGIHNIHVKRLIHFDIKPDNILITDNNEALVTDFGLAKSMNFQGIAEIDLFYPNHGAPEIFTNTKQSMLCDIYAAGVTLYRMSNGNKIFKDQEAQFKNDYRARITAINAGKFPDRTFYLPHIPKSLKTCINKATHIDTAKRHQTILELINDISSVDQLLDWQYSIDQNLQRWKLDLEEKIIMVELAPSGSSFTLNSTKTMKLSGKTQNISVGCMTNIGGTIINKTIYSLLEELDEKENK